MAHQDIKHTDPPFEFSEAAADVFIGTNACCRVHFEQRLLDRGIDADISLDGELIDRPAGVATYLWLPTPDHHPPTPENARIGIAALAKMLDVGRRVYIHCKNGHGRAPTFFAAFLMATEKLSAEDAVARIKAKRPAAHLEESQWKFLRAFVA